jgi:hypothetical protein
LGRVCFASQHIPAHFKRVSKSKRGYGTLCTVVQRMPDLNLRHSIVFLSYFPCRCITL